MLISNTAYTKGTVVSLRLVTGEEVIGKVVESTPLAIVLSKPMLVQLQQTPQGFGVATFPFMCSVNESDPLSINMDKVMVTSSTRDDIRAHYLKQTTGIEVPANSGLIR